MTTTTFEIQPGPSDEEKTAEAAALEQGEKIAQMQEQDSARQFEQREDENESAELIGGKFKSQEDMQRFWTGHGSKC